MNVAFVIVVFLMATRKICRREAGKKKSVQRGKLEIPMEANGKIRVLFYLTSHT